MELHLQLLVSSETEVTPLWSRKWKQTISAALGGHKGVNAVAESPQQKHFFCAAGQKAQLMETL